MYCPACGAHDTKVIDSRLNTDGSCVRRRRVCEGCDARFSTQEEMEILDLTVIKRDGQREPYRREKILRGIVRSLEKRPATEALIHQLVHRIECDIQRMHRTQVASAQIGECVLKHLKDFDQVAYIRFASIYRSFEDVATFQAELDRLKNQQTCEISS